MNGLVIKILIQILAQLLPALEPLVVNLVLKLSKEAMDKLLAWVAAADDGDPHANGDAKRNEVVAKARADADFDALSNNELHGAVEAAVAKHREIQGKGH